MNAGRVLILVALALFGWLLIEALRDPAEEGPRVGCLGMIVTSLLIAYGACR